MRKILNEQTNTSTPKDFKASDGKSYFSNNSSNTQINNNLLSDISTAARNSNQILTVGESSVNSVKLSFSLNTNEGIKTFTEKLKELGYVSGGTSPKNFVWSDKEYRVNNTENVSGQDLKLNVNLGNSNQGNEYDQMAKDVMKGIVSTQMGLNEEIIKIKKIMKL